MKILITGRQGFVGQYLESLLDKPDVEIFGYDLRDGQDLLNYEQLRNTLDKIRPDYIYHLAAQAFVPESFQNPKRAFEVNTIGSLNLLEGVRQLGLKPKILLAGTSEEYGDGDGTEESRLEPLSPYAISKVAMDHLGQLYAKSYNMQVVVTRAFNHTGPGRGEMYAESAFAKQIVEIEMGKRLVLSHGNLEPMRNYTDVRDVVKAYHLAIDLPPDVYNICSDQNMTVGDMLEALSILSLSDIKTVVSPDLYRPYDFSFRPPSCSKLAQLTGWRPDVPFQQTMTDILAYWRTELGWRIK